MTIQAVVKTGAHLTATFPVNCRNLARKSNGDLWCIYMRKVGDDWLICASYSIDDGVTWTEEVISTILNAPSLMDNPPTPALAVDSKDNVHAVWAHQYGYISSSKTEIKYCKREASWGSVEDVVVSESFAQRHISLALDSSDDVHVVWEGYGYSPATSKTNIQYRKKQAGTWQTQEAITEKAEDQRRPSIAIDSNDDIHVVWGGKDWGTNTVYYNLQYRKRTTSWQVQEAVTDVAGHQNFPSIVIDSSDQPHVAWSGLGWGTNTSIDNIQYRMRTTSWQTQEAITDIASFQWGVSLGIDGSDHLHAVWYGRGWGVNTTKNNIQWRKRITDWGSQVGITDGTEGNSHPSVIYSLNPVVGGGQQCNRPDAGFAFVWTGDIGTGYQVEYYGSSDLSWDYIQLLVKYASGQAKEVFT